MVQVSTGKIRRERARSSGRALQSTSGNANASRDRHYCHVNSCLEIIPSHCITNNVGTCPSCHVRTCFTCRRPAHNGECSPAWLNSRQPVTLMGIREYLLLMEDQPPMVADNDGHWKRDPGALTKREFAGWLKYKHRPKKGPKRLDGDIWPDHLEEALQIALRAIPNIGKLKTSMTDKKTGIIKLSGRNELICRKLWLLTGEERVRKQVSSHIQVIKKHFVHSIDWFQDSKLASSKNEREVSKNFEFDEERGELLFSDGPGMASQHHQAVGRQPRPSLLPPPSLTLLSSRPPRIPSVQKIELEMSVYPHTDDDSLSCRAYHTYTRMQSEMGAKPRFLPENPLWSERYPFLALIGPDSSQNDTEIILLESSLELTKTFSPQRSKLSIHCYADISCDEGYRMWEHRTRFFEPNGATSMECKGDVTNFAIPDASKTRVEISLFSKWWVRLFHEILERRHVIETSGDAQVLEQYDNKVREDIRGISVVQEIFARKEGEEVQTAIPAIIMLWLFRQTRSGEAATTSWRKLQKPIRPFRTESLSPELLGITDDQTPVPTQHFGLPVVPYHVSFPEPLPTGAGWGQWSQASLDLYVASELMNGHVDPDPYTSSTEPTIAGYKTVSSILAEQSVGPDQPFYQPSTQLAIPIEKYKEYYDPQLSSFSSQQQDAYFPADRMEAQFQASQETYQRIPDLDNADHMAANMLADLASHVTAITDNSSQCTTADYSTQSTAADFASQFTATDISSQEHVDYQQPNINDFTDLHLHLDFSFEQAQSYEVHEHDREAHASPADDLATSQMQLEQQQEQCQENPETREQHRHPLESYHNEILQTNMQHYNHNGQVTPNLPVPSSHTLYTHGSQPPDPNDFVTTHTFLAHSGASDQIHHNEANEELISKWQHLKRAIGFDTDIAVDGSEHWEKAYENVVQGAKCEYDIRGEGQVLGEVYDKSGLRSPLER